MWVLGFDWDEVNVRKLEHHALAPDDIEDLFESAPVVLRHPEQPRRWVALGFVPDARFVLVSFELDEATRWVRVVTAFEPTSDRWWRTYEKAKKTTP